MEKNNNITFDDTATNNIIVINRNAVSTHQQVRKTAEVITNMSRFYSNKARNGRDDDRVLIGRMITLN